MRPYELAPETYACVVCDGAVLLDLAHDLYLGLTVEQERALADLVTDWPAAAGSPASGDSASAHAFAESLCHRGLLICSEHAKRVCAEQAERACDEQANRVPRAPTHLPDAEGELIAWDEMNPRDIRFHHVVAFLRALSVVIAFLRFRSLLKLVHRCRRRRQSHPAPSERDLAHARKLVGVCTHLRTITFSRRGRCLLDSATLMEFLAFYGIHPNWVIGVRRHAPFGAHSWVQQGPWILNGTPAFVRSFVPILVV